MQRTLHLVGLCFSGVAALLALIVGVMYGVHYTGSVYLNATAIVLPIIAAVVFIPMAIFKVTRPYAAIPLCVITFIGFVVFVNATYLYLSEVFFGGLDGIKNIDPVYVVCVLFFLLATVLSNIGIYFMTAKEKQGQAPATQGGTK